MNLWTNYLLRFNLEEVLKIRLDYSINKSNRIINGKYNKS